MKHNPEVLLDLAESMRGDPDVAVVVISEGINADRLSHQASLRGLTSVWSLPLQPYELMPEVLSTGSVLVALLDESSGAFSVPSKVLSYLCAGRPLLLSVPPQNAAARIVQGNAAGLVVPPGDSGAFVRAAIRLRSDHDLRKRCAVSALAYARTAFDIQLIACQFNRACGLAPAAEPVAK